MNRPAFLRRSMIFTITMGLAISVMQGCSQQTVKEEAPKQSMNNEDYYEALHDDRLYVFDDAATFKSFLEVGETAYRKVRIGAGYHGETVVFGLTGKDKKKSSSIASIDMYDGKLEGAEPFYAEVHAEGRIHVFSSWKDLQAFKQVGEVPYRFTVIGAGPKGETVVYVLNKSNKKQQPTALMSAFKTMHASK